jgi:hypothetical protein
VVIGPISTPEKAASAVAIKNADWPARAGPTPTSWAPTRLIAVARKAFPVNVRPKNNANPAIAAREVRTTSRLCPVICTWPSENRKSVNGAVREPSAPNITRPVPTRAKCRATATISNVRTGACSNGAKHNRYSIGPVGTRIASVSKTWAACPACCSAGSRATAHTSAGMARFQARLRASIDRAVPWAAAHRSRQNTALPRPSVSQAVGGVRPACSAAIVSAPKATNSPTGM